MDEAVVEAGKLIRDADRIVVVSHERPDGDAIGSLLATTGALRQDGKTVSPILISGVPSRFQFLPLAEDVEKTAPDSCDLLIAVDCGGADRFGFPVEQLPRRPDINIDHHPTNTQFAPVNIVRTTAAATTEILYELIPQWGFDLTEEVATNLMVGLLTDTIGFRTTNTTARSLRVAADLIELGAPMADLYDRAISQMSFVDARYWGPGLCHLSHENGLVWTSLTLEDRHEVGYPGNDDADLVNVLMTIDEARVVVLFVEQPGGKVKISWRAQRGMDVSAVATQFGGGGHKPAAGATVVGELADVQQRVLAATRKLF
ncbi:MAG: bifunctional oligoribonuclease/PAP phosphatase NrnA [Anaerolineales bacterium]